MSALKEIMAISETHFLKFWLETMCDKKSSESRSTCPFQAETSVITTLTFLFTSLPPSLSCSISVLFATQQRPLLCVGGLLSPASPQPEAPIMDIWWSAWCKQETVVQPVCVCVPDFIILVMFCPLLSPL